MSTINHYSIFGMNVDSDLEEARDKALNLLKASNLDTVSVVDKEVSFSFGAAAFIDIFPEQSEVRIEVQAENRDAESQAQEIMYEHLLTSLEMSLSPATGRWLDITEEALAERAKTGADKDDRVENED